MNRFLPLVLTAVGLTFFNAPEATAHEELRSTRVVPAWNVDQRRKAHSRDYYERNSRGRDIYRYQRASRMPTWLKRKQAFRRWYRNTPLRRYQFMSWNQLFDIYRWERSYFQYHRH